MVKHAGPEGHKALLELANHTLQTGTLPKVWKESITVPIPKPDGSHRPIELLSCVGKTVEKMIKARIEHKIGKLHKNLFAYQKNTGTQNALASIQRLLSRPNAVVITIDLEKAFELCSPEVVLDSLCKKGIKGSLLKWVKDFLHGRSSQTLYHGYLSSMRTLERGTPQGSSLSPLLFNLVMERLLDVPHGANVHLFSFADDLTVVAVGESSLEEAERTIALIEDRCDELGLKINDKKNRGHAN